MTARNFAIEVAGDAPDNRQLDAGALVLTDDGKRVRHHVVDQLFEIGQARGDRHGDGGGLRRNGLRRRHARRRRVGGFTAARSQQRQTDDGHEPGDCRHGRLPLFESFVSIGIMPWRVSIAIAPSSGHDTGINNGRRSITTLCTAPDPAPNPRRMQMFLAVKGLDFPSTNLSLTSREHKSAATLARNPRGQVPFLELDEGSVIAETVWICRYLDELHPEPPLFGTSASDRARTDM